MPRAPVQGAAPAAEPVSEDLHVSLDWPDHLVEAYKLGRVYGHGAFGTIRLARHRVTGESVAIKVLSKMRPQQTRARTASKLLRELECLARVQSCESVIELRGIFEDTSSAYLVMEHCTGGDLEQLLERGGPLTENQVATVVWEVLKVVTACHSSGVCHGDIKPANFLLSEKLPAPLHQLQPGCRPGPGAWLKAIDFGCAQLAPASKQLSRRTGTPVYMAPEVFERKYGRSADLWSVGMLAYHMLSGRFPFWETMEQCKKSSLEEVMEKVAHAEIALNWGPFLAMSPEGKQLLEGLLTRDPERRLTAAQAQQHPWFKLHLGWEAEAPRIAGNLPHLIAQWGEPSPAPATPQKSSQAVAPAAAAPLVANNVVPRVPSSPRASEAGQPSGIMSSDGLILQSA